MFAAVDEDLSASVLNDESVIFVKLAIVIDTSTAMEERGWTAVDCAHDGFWMGTARVNEKSFAAHYVKNVLMSQSKM